MKKEQQITACPFTLITKEDHFRDVECPKYSFKRSFYCRGVVFEYCSLAEHVREYEKTGAMLISCEGCSYRKNNYQEKSNVSVQESDREVADSEVSTRTESTESAMDFFRDVGKI